jgi:two-component system OmpR family sensor kinase
MVRGRGIKLRSFRFILGIRVTVLMIGAVSAVALSSFLVLRQALDREINASLMSVASVQAATVTDDPSGEMHFHEWELTPEEATSLRDLVRYLQIWNTEGESLIRSRFIDEDLPLDTLALAQAGEGELVWTEGTFQGVSVRALYYPLERLGQLHTRHVLQVAAPLVARDRMLRQLGILLLAIVITVGITTFPGAWWLASRAVQPVDAIVDQAEAIGAGAPSGSIEAYADTLEYARLVQVLNRMLGRLDAALETQRRFTADASHELRTPLTVLRGELEVALRRNRTPEEYTRVLRSSLEEAERLSRLAEDLLTLTRSEAGAQKLQVEKGDLAEQVQRAVRRFTNQADAKEIDLSFSSVGGAFAEYDSDLMDRVAWNLLGNALNYTPKGGEVGVRVAGDGERLTLSVQDTGPGIPPHRLESIFDRFVRIDEARTSGTETSGTGLGLAIVKAIVTLHGGTVTAENRSGGGALFRVTLPMSRVVEPVPGSRV